MNFYRKGSSLFIKQLLALLILSLPMAKAQDYYFSHHSVMQGLAQSKVYDITQDTRGYVWLGTESGVSRFDGNRFLNFSPNDGLATGSCRTLYLDKNQVLWVGHTSGAISYFKDNTFIRHPLSDDLTGDVTDIFQDAQGNLWITTYGDGVYLLQNQYLFKGDSCKVMHIKGKELSDRIFSGLVTQQGEVYLITDAGIKKQDAAGRFVNYLPKGLTTYWQITSMLEDSHGDQWFGTHNGGLYRLIKESGKFIVYDARDGLGHNFISTLIEDQHGDVWAGTWGGGVTRFHNGFITTYNKSNGLDDERIHALWEDWEGNILVGTNEHGLGIFKGDAWLTFGEKDGLKDKQVWAVQEDNKGQFWFATNDGLFVFDPYLPRDKRKTAHYNQQTNAIGNQIRFITMDAFQNLWFGTLDNGLMQYNTKDERFIYDPIINQYFQTNNLINALTCDRKGNLWIGTLEGLLKYDLETNEIVQFSQLQGLQGNEVTCLQMKSSNSLFVGTADKGVDLWVENELSPIPCAEAISPTCFALSEKGVLWVGTRAKGLFVYKDDSLHQVHNHSGGLLSDYISQLQFGPDGLLYVGTNRGVNRIDEEGKITTFTEKSGFTGIEAKPNGNFLDSKNNLWFGTVGGAMQYRPNRDFVATLEPFTHITEVMVNSVPQNFYADDEFNFRENQFVFRFHSVCLRNPEAVSYEIMLEGADRSWREVEDQRSATYSSLAPGEYIFKVRAKNGNGQWNEQPQAYAFVINPPFWRQAWFIAAIIGLGLSIIFAYIKIRERNLVRDKHILEQKVEERTAEVVQKSEELASKNKDITDSIKYAQRIQYAILPPALNGEDLFVFFQPKDIVSGDFYWYEQANGRELFAAVDCTGHGVPGAFLSILGANLLTKIVKEYGILEPADILNRLNEEIGKALHQRQQSGDHVVNDGMDLALIAYNKAEQSLAFAGAYNPMYLIRNKTLTEVKANRFSIGRDSSNINRQFTQHQVKINKGDCIYLFSDGYADQFGGPDNRKLRKKAFKELLIEISDFPMNERRERLSVFIKEWMGPFEQIDDMVVLGRQF